MIIRGVIRFETKRVQAAKRGLLTQYRAPAYAYDPQNCARKSTPWGRARVGDIFWLGEPAVYWTTRGESTQHNLVFKADDERGFAAAPKWIAGRRGLKRHTLSPEKLARAWSKRCLLVIGARLEKLNSITSADAEACGCEMVMFDGRPKYRMWDDNRCEGITPQEAFLLWWKRLYGEISATSNPEVAVLDFKLIEENADAYLATANDADLGALRAADEAVGERAA